MQLTKNFSKKELECKCGCGMCAIDEKALEALQLLRDVYGKPMIINSAARCWQHNEAVGGAPDSMHLSQYCAPSCAFDVRLTPGMDQEEFVKKARACGFNGIGLYKTFTHIDTRPYNAFWDNR